MKLKVFLYTFLASALAVSIAGAYAAAGAPEFKKLDKDRDGFISSDESGASPIILQNFSLLDRNTDGKLSKEEYAAVDAASSGGSSSGGAGGAPSSSAPPPSSAPAPDTSGSRVSPQGPAGAPY